MRKHSDIIVNGVTISRRISTTFREDLDVVLDLVLADMYLTVFTVILSFNTKRVIANQLTAVFYAPGACYATPRRARMLGACDPSIRGVGYKVSPLLHC
jgi:hypothetical protein